MAVVRLCWTVSGIDSLEWTQGLTSIELNIKFIIGSALLFNRSLFEPSLPIMTLFKVIVSQFFCSFGDDRLKVIIKP